MLNLVRKPLIMRLIAWLVLVPFMMMTSGCSYFRIHSSEKPYPETINQLQDDQKFVILHLDDNAWHFTDITTDDNVVKGTITDLTGHQMYKVATPDKAIRYRAYGTMNQKEVINEVHVYTKEMNVLRDSYASVPGDAITKVEVYSKAKGATIISHLSVPLAIGVGVFLIIFIIAILTSCPFVYVFDGEVYFFTGEIFSGAIQPGLERDDYLFLPRLAPFDGNYMVKVTNELKERQYLNLAELMIVDHGSDVSVLADKNGVFHSLSSPEVPLSAVTGEQTDILALLEEKDTLRYTGAEGIREEKGTNSIVLEFVKPEAARSANLVIRARNTLWMETVSSKIHELFGERFEAFSEKRDEVPGEKLLKWQLDQKLPLLVYVEKNDKWEFVDYFNIAGPVAMRDDILSLDLEGIDPGPFRIKLETGFMFWEVDYAAVDFSSQEQLSVARVSLTKATANDNLEVKESIAAKDNVYYILDEQGDETVLVFECPEMKSECRSVFLHTGGYYKVLRDQTGPADKKALRSFRKPGRVPAFSRELFNELQ